MPSAAEPVTAALREPRPMFWALVAITVVLDRVTKLIAASSLHDRVVPVVGDVVQFRLVHNTGAAFGLDLGAYSRWIFMAVAIVAVGFLYRMAQQTPLSDHVRQYAVGFVAGGAAGNLIDRILTSRGVIDYIDVGVSPTLRWPTFNVADIAVSCGAVALAFSLWREDARRAPAPSSSA